MLFILFQGSVVVFGSWPNWTSTNLLSEDYCKETPMMFAFVLLLISWVCFVIIYFMLKEICISDPVPCDDLLLLLYLLCDGLCWCCWGTSWTGTRTGWTGPGRRCWGGEGAGVWTGAGLYTGAGAELRTAIEHSFIVATQTFDHLFCVQ